MVKNIPTIERSTKIRFGKHVSENQAENTIVFNASDTAIDVTNSNSIYMAPLRVAELAGSNLVGYSSTTKEIVDSSVPTTLLGGVTLQSSTDRGNVTSNTVQFSNAITSFVTSSNIGVANSAPIHALSVKDKVFMCGPTGDTNALRVEGTARATKFTTGSSVNIDENVTNKIQVSGTIHTSTLTSSAIGVANTAPAHAISIGNEGQVQLNVPTDSIYALDTVGNVNAQNYRGDSYYLSNLTVENIVNQGNVTSNTVQFTNPLTSIYTSSNVDVGGNIFVRNNTDSAIYGTIAGSNTIAGSTITASTQFDGPGTGLTGIPTNQFASGAIAVPSGGTGQTEYVDGTILYGKLDGGTSSLGKLNPGSGVTDDGKFLRLNSDHEPEWAEVPLTLDAVLGDTTAVSDGSMSLTDSGTTITTAGKIKAATFEGSGSDIHDINAANVVQFSSSTLSTSVLPIVPVTKGGTNLNSVTAGDILYASADDTIAGLDKGTANKVLQMNSGATLPEWTSTITGASLANPSLTGTITTSGLNNNRIPFTNASGILSSDTNLQFDGSNNKMTIGADVLITGAFATQGAVDHFNTTNYTVTDPIIEVGNNNSTDTIDLGMIMTMGTANVVHGFRGLTKEYTIAYTHSNPADTDITPTLTSGISNHPYITANIWGNVLSGNVTTTGKMTSDSFHGDGSDITHLNLGGVNNYGQVATARGGTGVSTGLTVLNPAYLSSQVLLAKGGTGLTTVAENELLLGPASGTALDTLPPYTAASTIEYPTSALSSAANSGETIAGITYTTTASSNSYGEIWKAFDKTTPGHSTFWHSNENVYDSTSGAYTGSNSLGSVSGEWIKLQLSTAITPISVNITGRVSYDNQAPDSWEILGSTNNSSWTSLLSSTVHATYNGGSGHTVSISGASAYTYLALVVKAKGGTGQNAVVLSEVRFFTANPNPAKKFLRSSAAGIDWDEVSSDLQTITDGGATTTQTVAFNNTTTGLTSAGDIDIAATKQIDYAGDVLLKSSAGTVASLKVTNAVKLDPAYASPSNNVLSFNTTTGEIYDSGGQGGSTLDNVHEYKANISIGPSVAAANLTINVFESNVLTVSGNVSADSITIGALHVAASPFNLDDVSQATVGANVTSNVIQFTGPHSSYNSDNAFVTTNSIKIGSNVNVTGNLISQNIQLTNPGITVSMSSTDTITIDAKNKSYGTAPLVQLAGDLNSLVYSNLIDGAQVVVPIFASGADRKISKNLTNVNWYVQTSDLTIKQSEHGLMTLSNVAGNVYMNSISFTQN